MTLEHIDLKTFIYMGKQEDLFLVEVTPGDPFDKFLFTDTSQREVLYIHDDNIYPGETTIYNIDEFEPIGRVLNDTELVMLSSAISHDAMVRLEKERIKERLDHLRNEDFDSLLIPPNLRRIGKGDSV